MEIYHIINYVLEKLNYRTSSINVDSILEKNRQDLYFFTKINMK